MGDKQLMSIAMYLTKHSLTIEELAKKLDVQAKSIYDWKSGVKPNKGNKEKLRRFGITCEASTKRDLPNGAKEAGYKGFLKDFQIYAIQEFGNTIVSKEHSKQTIVDEFAKLGIAVKVRDFETVKFSCTREFDSTNKSHWVVEDLEGLI